MPRYMTAKEAAQALGVSLSTLYAYVSRGIIRSEASAESKRQRRYYREDVEKLIARKAGRHNPEKLAQDALHWGAPILESAITLITEDRLYYRGHDVAQLARERRIEEVAALIWTGDMDSDNLRFDVDVHGSALQYETMLLHVEVDGAVLSTIQALSTFLPIAAADDTSAYDLRTQAVATTGARILRLMTSVAAGDVPENLSIAEMLQQGWASHAADAVPLLNAALILCADHELNASSFTARVVASAGASPYAVVMAGLAALQGAKHGGEIERVAALLREVETSGKVRETLAARLRLEERVPGFGHRLYTNGDPRSKLLLDMLHEWAPDAPAVTFAQRVIQAAHELIGEAPSIDFSLVILGRALQLPPDAPLALFALGRTIGWIGHAIEQYETNRLIRPRARYNGVQPS